MRKTLFSSLAVLLLLAGASARAQESKPLVVFSIAPLDHLLQDIGYVAGLSGQADAAQQVQLMAGFMTQGLDKSRPIGGVVSTDGVTFPAMVFVPVTNLDMLLRGLGAFVSEPDDAGDGILEVEIKANAQSMFIKEQNGWAFIAQSAESLADVPQDPMTLLGGLEKKYDLAIQGNVHNIPEPFRQMAEGLITQGMQDNLNPQPDEDPAAFEARKEIAEQQLASIVQSINETDQLTIGWAVDRENKKTLLDVSATAVAGSASAASLASLQNLTTQFSGFTPPDAMVSGAMASKLVGDEAVQAKTSLAAIKIQFVGQMNNAEDFPNEEARELYLALFDDVINMLNVMIDGGRFDLGFSIVGEGPFTLIGGMEVGEGASVMPIVDKIAAVIKLEGNLAAFDKNFDKAGPVDLHRISIKAPPGDEAQAVAQILGPGDVPLIAGTGGGKFYLAFGADAASILRKGIEASAAATDTAVLPLNFSVSLAPIIKAAAQSKPDDENLAQMATSLADSDKDHVRIQYLPTENGAVFRIEAEEGIFQLAPKAPVGGGGAPF